MKGESFLRAVLKRVINSKETKLGEIFYTQFLFLKEKNYGVVNFLKRALEENL